MNDEEKPKRTLQPHVYVPFLTEQELGEVERRVTPSAAVVHETIRVEGEQELLRPSQALAWSGLAAGLSMGFSLVVQGILRANLPEELWTVLITRLGYCIGFLIVILGRQQLFTENTVLPILPLLERRDLPTLLNVLRLWSVVLATNLLGTLVFAWVLAFSYAFDPPVHRAFEAISLEAMAGSFWTIFLKAIFAGWLIALMVWLLPVAATARVSVIIIITYVVGLARLAHSVAGSVEAFYVIVTGLAPWEAYLRFIIPTLLGNILGGVLLVSALNYAQVMAGGKR